MMVNVYEQKKKIKEIFTTESSQEWLENMCVYLYTHTVRSVSVILHPPSPFYLYNVTYHWAHWL